MRPLATVTAELRTWIATFGKDAGRLREFPSRLIAELSEHGRAASEATPLLLELVPIAMSIVPLHGDGRNAYDGQDLRMVIEVVAALASIGAKPALVQPLLDRFIPDVDDPVLPTPGGGDPDKFDRDMDLYHSQLELRSNLSRLRLALKLR